MNYKKTLIVKANQKSVFVAVSKELNKWWGKVDNSNISQEKDIFSIYFEETEWRFEITKFSMYDEIHWKCIKANHIVPDLSGTETEWLNSEIIWKFKNEEDDTEISFEHKGLTPELNCYEVCNAGWDFFITNSLKDHLEKGEGSPQIIK